MYVVVVAAATAIFTSLSGIALAHADNGGDYYDTGGLRDAAKILSQADDGAFMYPSGSLDTPVPKGKSKKTIAKRKPLALSASEAAKVNAAVRKEMQKVDQQINTKNGKCPKGMDKNGKCITTGSNYKAPTYITPKTDPKTKEAYPKTAVVLPVPATSSKTSSGSGSGSSSNKPSGSTGSGAGAGSGSSSSKPSGSTGSSSSSSSSKAINTDNGRCPTGVNKAGHCNRTATAVVTKPATSTGTGTSTSATNTNTNTSSTNTKTNTNTSSTKTSDDNKTKLAQLSTICLAAQSKNLTAEQWNQYSTQYKSIFDSIKPAPTGYCQALRGKNAVVDKGRQSAIKLADDARKAAKNNPNALHVKLGQASTTTANRTTVSTNGSTSGEDYKLEAYSVANRFLIVTGTGFQSADKVNLTVKFNDTEAAVNEGKIDSEGRLFAWSYIPSDSGETLAKVIAEVDEAVVTTEVPVKSLDTKTSTGTSTTGTGTGNTNVALNNRGRTR